MSIKAAYMVPHPPMIIPEVGHGSEKQIIDTIESYEEIAKEIAEINPETIIISSPHTLIYNDYFHLSTGDTIEGDLNMFRAPSISFKEEIDTELVEEIERIAALEEFPAGRTKETILDHGTIVPLYFIRKYLPKCKIIVIGYSGLPLIANYRMGMIIKEAINNLNRSVVYIASGDLSHKLQEDGPYGFIEEGPIYDQRIMDVCFNKRFNELLEFKESFLEKAAECGHRSFTIMAGVLDSLDIESKYYSHEDITGVGYGIISFKPIGDNKNRNYLTKYLEREKLRVLSIDEYVKLARKTIYEYIKNNTIIEVPYNLNKKLLEEKHGVFVSIHKFDKLRGCIGTILPVTENVATEIIRNAIAASTQDPRFNKISEDELDYLEINVDVLTEPEDIDNKNLLDPKKYGVIVISGYKRGLLLPDLEGIDDIDTQISIAKQKANITEDEEIKLQRFEVIRHK